MKHLLMTLCALALALEGLATPLSGEMRQAVAEIRTMIDDAERQAVAAQSLEELNAAAREQVVRELKLTKKQRVRFDPLYDAYRKALARAVETERAEADAATADEATQRRLLKTRLENISATAQVKRDYVDRFAEILTAEQIRRLYNAEGQIATSIKRVSGYKHAGSTVTINGRGRKVTQDLGAVGDYTAIEAASFFRITVSPTARTVSVTADERLIDYIRLDVSGGVVRLHRTAQIKSKNADIGVQVVVPASPSLHSLKAGAYGSIECPQPLRGASVSVEVSSYGRIRADLASDGKATLRISSYGKFEGAVTCGECDFSLSSYGAASGPIVCRGQAAFTIGSYARFTEAVRASGLRMAVSSGATVTSPLECDDLQLTVGSYGRFDGRVACSGDAEVTVSSGASFKGSLDSRTLRLGISSYARFAGTVKCQDATLTTQTGASLDARLTADSFDATVGSYSKIRLDGDATVARGQVNLSTSGNFSAPALRVTEYRIEAGSYSRADVWCAQSLHVDAAQTARVTYDGPCRMEAKSSNIRRK